MGNTSVSGRRSRSLSLIPGIAAERSDAGMREVVQRANAEIIELHGKPSLLLNFVPFGINLSPRYSGQGFYAIWYKKRAKRCRGTEAGPAPMTHRQRSSG
jgi:hypothetical protein